MPEQENVLANIDGLHDLFIAIGVIIIIYRNYKMYLNLQQNPLICEMQVYFF